jgi:hypothetical protein
MEKSRIVLDSEFLRLRRYLHLIDQTNITPGEETVLHGRVPHFGVFVVFLGFVFS